MTEYIKCCVCKRVNDLAWEHLVERGDTLECGFCSALTTVVTRGCLTYTERRSPWSEPPHTVWEGFVLERRAAG